MFRNRFMQAIFFLSIVSVVLASAAQSQVDIYIRGATQLVKIALPQLCAQGAGSTAAADVPRIVARDLDLSGYFDVVDPKTYIEATSKCGGAESIVYSDWTVIGAAFVVRGVVESSGSRVRVQLYLQDVSKQAMIMGKEYEGSVSDIPSIANRFANEVMRFFTGVYGPWGTQVAFSTRVGRFKELAIMDANGENVQQLSNDHSLNTSVAWHPSGRSLLYTSYRNHVPDVFNFDIASRMTRQITSGAALEVGSIFTRDGGSILTSRSDGGGSDIVQLSLEGATMKRVTQSGGAIDVSPRLSPDGSQIVFTSSRGGGPQIYLMGSDGGGARRISFVSSNYCTSPAWSPKGDKIAFVCRADGGFNLFAANADGSSPLQLTSFGNNEDPDWSPDGRYLVFSSTFGKGQAFGLGLIRIDGSNIRELTTSRGGDFDPAWGPQLDRPADQNQSVN